MINKLKRGRCLLTCCVLCWRVIYSFTQRLHDPVLLERSGRYMLLLTRRKSGVSRENNHLLKQPILPDTETQRERDRDRERQRERDRERDVVEESELVGNICKMFYIHHMFVSYFSSRMLFLYNTVAGLQLSVLCQD